jgi:hypothetical protein
MKCASEHSAEFVGGFAQLAAALASIDVVIAQLRLDYSTFGCWSLVATKREEAVRIVYDGRESYVTTEVSPIRKFSFPNEWVHVETKGIDNRNSEALAYAESFLKKRFTV